MKPDTNIKRLKLKDQLSVDPYKAFALVENLLNYLVLMTCVLFFAEYFGITDTFKSNLLVGGAIGAPLGFAYILFSDAALAEWRIPGRVNPQALQNAMLALKHTEKQPRVYQPERPLFSLFYRYKSERITLQTVGDNTLVTGPYNQLKKLSAFALADAQPPLPAPASDHTPPTVQG